jgi:hypothetical protein
LPDAESLFAIGWRITELGGVVQQQLGDGVALGSRMVQRELVLKRE